MSPVDALQSIAIIVLGVGLWTLSTALDRVMAVVLAGIQRDITMLEKLIATLNEGVRSTTDKTEKRP